MQRIYINDDEKLKSAAELNNIGPYFWEESFEEYKQYNWKKDRKIKFICSRCLKPCVMTRQYIHEFVCKSCKCKERESKKDQVAIHNKAKETMLQRYGVSNPAQLPDFKDKVKATSQLKYGADHYNKSQEGRKRSSEMRQRWIRSGKYKEITDKGQKTFQERYGFNRADPVIIQQLRDGSLAKFGTEFPMQSDKCKEQVKETVKSKYGVESVNQLESKKAAARHTCIEKYGVPYFSETPDFLEQWRATVYDRYGVLNPIQNSKIKAKMKKTLIDHYGVDNAAFIDRRSPLLIQSRPVIQDVEFINISDGKYHYRCSECGADIISAFMNPSCIKCHPRNNSEYVDDCAKYLQNHYKGEVITNPNLRFPADIWIPEYKVGIIINMTYYCAVGDRNKGIVTDEFVIKRQSDEFYLWNPDGMLFITTEKEFKQFKLQLINSILTYLETPKLPDDPYVMELNKKDADRFLKNYYNPDPHHWETALGLFNGAELIAVAAFRVHNYKCRIYNLQCKKGWAPDYDLLFNEIMSEFKATKIYYEADYRINNARYVFDKLNFDELTAPCPVYYFNDNIVYLHVKHMEAETHALLDRLYDGSLTPYENIEKQCYTFYDAGKIKFSLKRFD